MSDDLSFSSSSHQSTSSSSSSSFRVRGLIDYSSSSSDDNDDPSSNNEKVKGREDNLKRSPRKRKLDSSSLDGPDPTHHLNLEDKFPVPKTREGFIDINSQSFDWIENITQKLNFLFPSSSSSSSSDLNRKEDLKDSGLTEDDLFENSDDESSISSDTEYIFDGTHWDLKVGAKRQHQSPESKSKKVLSDEKNRITPRSSQQEAKASTSGGGSGESTSSQQQEKEDPEEFKKPKFRCRKFMFKPFKRDSEGNLTHDNSKAPVDVVIPEQLAASYGLYIWPCSPVLSWYLWLHQTEFVGKTILELGAGTSLPGLLSAKIGASKVWLTDDGSNQNTLNNITEAVRINKLEDRVSVHPLTWGLFYDNLFQFENNLDYIIGSDLFFDPKVFEDLVTTVAYLLDINRKAEFYCAVQERCPDWSIEEYLERFNLKADYIHPKEFLAGTGIDEVDLIGGHTIYIMKLNKTMNVH